MGTTVIHGVGSQLTLLEASEIRRQNCLKECQLTRSLPSLLPVTNLDMLGFGCDELIEVKVWMRTSYGHQT